ncbi:MAG TPA: hypothetical protein HA362_01960 [Nanoarchaeota archaeon]|nr:hypothetical protein [Nanoarchaeota archaeon]
MGCEHAGKSHWIFGTPKMLGIFKGSEYARTVAQPDCRLRYIHQTS